MKNRQDKEQIAEKAIKELVSQGNLKKLSQEDARVLAMFYDTKSFNRLQTAKAIHKLSQERTLKPQLGVTMEYTDNSEVVSASYYAMYYIVHAYLAGCYRTKLTEGLRGVHAITHKIILYYLVKTKKLAKHLYDEYVKTLEVASTLQNLSPDSFMDDAYKYAEQYDNVRTAREVFTYNTNPKVEAPHAERAIKTAEEFIATIRQLIQR